MSGTHLSIPTICGVVFLGSAAIKNLPANAGTVGLIPGSGRSPGGGHGNSLQYSCLENPTDKEFWWSTVHGVAKELDIA